MTTKLSAVFALMILVAAPAFAQGRERELERPRANQGTLPHPPARRAEHVQPEVHQFEGGRRDEIPHVDRNHWYGHDEPRDPRYRLEQPFEHGRFEHFGPEHRYGVEKVDHDRHRFWFLGGSLFEVAPWDWPLAEGWCWQCGDDFVVYEDEDHVGWYLLYDVHTGHYVHVRYLGR